MSVRDPSPSRSHAEIPLIAEVVGSIRDTGIPELVERYIDWSESLDHLRVLDQLFAPDAVAWTAFGHKCVGRQEMQKHLADLIRLGGARRVKVWNAYYGLSSACVRMECVHRPTAHPVEIGVDCLIRFQVQDGMFTRADEYVKDHEIRELDTGRMIHRIQGWVDPRWFVRSSGEPTLYSARGD